jgi:hypothetical protein
MFSCSILFYHLNFNNKSKKSIICYRFYMLLFTSTEYEKEELLRNVFRKARQKAKEELSQQLSEFQVKRQVGLGTLYGPEDAVIEKCHADKAQVRGSGGTRGGRVQNFRGRVGNAGFRAGSL